MSLTKAETDTVMLLEASKSDGVFDELITQIRVRNTSSVHPKDCQCLVCKNLRYRNSNINETEVRNSLDYYTGD